MGYIEELAAREANRQEANRARAVQAAQVMNQNVGLADVARVQQGYQPNGLSDVEANAIAQRNAIAQKAYERAAAEQYARSKEVLGTTPQGNIDPGLASRYAADRAAFR